MFHAGGFQEQNTAKSAKSPQMCVAYSKRLKLTTKLNSDFARLFIVIVYSQSYFPSEIYELIYFIYFKKKKM